MRADRLWAILFPPKCIFCGRLLPPDSPQVCPGCLDEVRLAEGEAGLRKGAFFDRAVGALVYEGRVRKALHRFKFSGKQNYAAPLARVVAYAVEQRLGRPFDLIVAVPTNRRNVRRRGYNHAELLGRELAVLTGAPYLNALQKLRETRPMFGLRVAERRANVLGAIGLYCRPEAVAGRRVLLVDDLMTTGATLSECARILLENGVLAVCGACVAMAPRQKP